MIEKFLAYMATSFHHGGKDEFMLVCGFFAIAVTPFALADSLRAKRSGQPYRFRSFLMIALALPIYGIFFLLMPSASSAAQTARLVLLICAVVLILLNAMFFSRGAKREWIEAREQALAAPKEG